MASGSGHGEGQLVGRRGNRQALGRSGPGCGGVGTKRRGLVDAGERHDRNHGLVIGGIQTAAQVDHDVVGPCGRRDQLPDFGARAHGRGHVVHRPDEASAPCRSRLPRWPSASCSWSDTRVTPRPAAGGWTRRRCGSRSRCCPSSPAQPQNRRLRPRCRPASLPSLLRQRVWAWVRAGAGG